MRVCKSGFADGTEPDLKSELAAVNSFAKSAMTEEEVFIFPVLLCDNEVDRDFERFTERTLAELAELFVGRTGVSDHNWSAAAQKARLYRTELVTGEGKNTLGMPYQYLKGYAYMLRTEGNAELIAEIQGGIRKETSVGCSVSRSICSVCGEELGSAACSHIKGREYGGRLCYAELDGAVDAYEWSFVAVPAQRGAGVIKRFAGTGLKGFVSGGEGAEFRVEFEALERDAGTGRRYMASLRGEVLRLALLWDEKAHEALCGSVAIMDETALEQLKAAFSDKLRDRFPPVTQLPGKNAAAGFDGAEYVI